MSSIFTFHVKILTIISEYFRFTDSIVTTIYNVVLYFNALELAFIEYGTISSTINITLIKSV